MEKIFNFLLGRADFCPFETRIIEEVKARLNERAASLLQRQMEAINKVQRLADGKEVNLYQMRFGKPAFDESLRFPNTGEEALLASVNLIAPGKQAKLKAEVWLANGRLFSLAFNKAPKQFFAGSDLKTVQPEIADVKIWFDPLSPSPAGFVDESMLPAWLLNDGRSLADTESLRAPLPQSEQAAYIARVDAQLPQDYLELIARTEGLTLASAVVYGLAKVREVIFPEANYYILADIEGVGALAVKSGNQSAELYRLDYENSTTQKIGTSFQKAVTELVMPR
ncbi:hypothetical protein FNU76_19325 [Chitinimonas arctica]|uniref:Uncharacterized protein n=1 Tax=Chitinimonas arctica TaxID=2594795 RepID=A0A516SJU3_9NEIS|nr:hypothetical protein [Chitinimonas arctica]QDQ28328.1 hypothetical protein FNU76_19325 [Chitinimonas arctica]